MGAPTSGIIAEFFLQNLEDTHLTHLSNEHKIVRYFRYVDDILIIYDSSHTDINSIQNGFNTIHPNIEFTTETESSNQINFLDITIHRTPTNWRISICRKPTFTDNYPVLLKPPSPPQICSSKISTQQIKHIPPTER
jgi:hypothetical protein